MSRPTRSASSSAAVATAAELSFHCIICFDQFNLTDRAPVVLPCGHTYVCGACAKRLTTCMECRTPLSLPAPSPRPSTTAAARQAPGRYGRYHTAPSVPPTKIERIPLPLPKNVVLMAMMEAAERQTRKQQQQHDDEDETNRIVTGVEMLAGTCGTYAVAEQEGLVVLSNDPRRTTRQGTEHTAEPFMVERGQLVQVVDLSDGVAVLAREMGYIVVTENKQLVKVGGPLEKSCQLQGTYRMLDSRKRALEQELQQLQEHCLELKKSIDAERIKEPSHPVITPPSLLDDDNEDDEEDKLTVSPTPTLTHSSTQTSPSRDVKISASYDADGFELVEEVGDDLLSPRTIDNSDIKLYVDQNTQYPLSDSLVPEQIQFGCPAFFGAQCTDSEEADGMLGLSLEDVRPPALERDAVPREDRRLASPSRSSPSSETINFRTGMSGHRGLSRVQRQGATESRQPRMMGEHRGIAQMRGPAKMFGLRNTNP